MKSNPEVPTEIGLSREASRVSEVYKLEQEPIQLQIKLEGKKPEELIENGYVPYTQRRVILKDEDSKDPKYLIHWQKHHGPNCHTSYTVEGSPRATVPSEAMSWSLPARFNADGEVVVTLSTEEIEKRNQESKATRVKFLEENPEYTPSRDWLVGIGFEDIE